MKNLYQRINDVMLEVTTVVKDTNVQVSQDRGYLAVSHDAVTKALHLPLAKAGIVVKTQQTSCVITDFEVVKSWNGKETKSKNYRADIVAEVTLINADTPDQRESYTMSAYAFDTGDKAIGKAFSMAIKNILLKAFMLESLDHEEDRSAEGDEMGQKPTETTKSAVSDKPVAPKAQTTKKFTTREPAKDPLMTAFERSGWTVDQMKTHLKENFNVDSSDRLRPEQKTIAIENLRSGKTFEQARTLPSLY